MDLGKKVKFRFTLLKMKVTEMAKITGLHKLI